MYAWTEKIWLNIKLIFQHSNKSSEVCWKSISTNDSYTEEYLLTDIVKMSCHKKHVVNTNVHLNIYFLLQDVSMF